MNKNHFKNLVKATLNLGERIAEGVTLAGFIAMFIDKEFNVVAFVATVAALILTIIAEFIKLSSNGGDK